ncbi:MAG: sodium:calcium antiporter [Alicyclobacillus sp.]|nr:sodium:calcium antiporter [Alicyclobacillus sp.]
MQAGLSMLFALAMVLFGAELFTNAVEWLGCKLNLGQSAVGSVLAALGTALPETAVPVAAILFGSDSSAQEVGIGGILGAPFLLVTLGSAIVACALVLARRQTGRATSPHVQRTAFQRDMAFFIIAYSFVLVVGVAPWRGLHLVAPGMLVGVYGYFLWQSFRDRSEVSEALQLHPLYLQGKRDQPLLAAVLLQLTIALAAIVGGARLLASGVAQIAVWLDVPPFVLSALLIPLATELPETLNSVVWIRQGKDALALGNITGALVFQSTLVPALGIGLTDWKLTPQALLAGGLTLVAGLLVYGTYRLRGRVVPSVLFAVSLLYWVLPLHALAVRYTAEDVFWLGTLLLLAVLLFTLRAGLRAHRTS